MGQVTLPDCPEVKIIMTGNLSEDPKEWSEAGHLTTKAQREAIKERMKDPDDPLKIVLVCDMWLTGTDIPCLHTLFIDKPLQGHTMIQAISRVNRVFRDKPNGVIVDYIGIADDLRQATSEYTQGGGRGEPAPDLETQAVPLFFGALEGVRALLPTGTDYGDWPKLSRIDLEDRYMHVLGLLTGTPEDRDRYLQTEHRLSKAFILVKHLEACAPYADEVIFYQRVRKQLLKTLPGRRAARDVETAVHDLVDDRVAATGVVDIFALAGIERADISILDDDFLQTYKGHRAENLQVTLLGKLLDDEIRRRQPKNVAKAKSFSALLESTLQRYHARLIDSAVVIKAMIELRQAMEHDDARAAELGLSAEELAFYDAVAALGPGLYDNAFLSALIHEVVASIRLNLKVDWTRPHRDDVKAAVASAVKRVLRRRGVGKADLERFMGAFMTQAEALYADWPLAA